MYIYIHYIAYAHVAGKCAELWPFRTKQKDGSFERGQVGMACGQKSNARNPLMQKHTRTHTGSGHSRNSYLEHNIFLSFSKSGSQYLRCAAAACGETRAPWISLQTVLLAALPE